jgi:hypothetical protein
MNYLVAVNKVLQRLRERSVVSVTDTDYSLLIGLFINDAKREVEEAWDWSALRTSLTVTTTSGIFNYELNGTQNDVNVLSALNASTSSFLRYETAHWFNTQYLGTPASGAPAYYSFNGVGTDGDTLIDLYPKPDGVYTLRFNVVARTADLEDSADTFHVPAHPVVMLAYAKAVEERGEDNGQMGNTAFMVANKALNDAIQLDANKHPEELIWTS